MCMFVQSFSCSNLNNLNECVQLEVKHRTDHPILFPRALFRPNCMTDHPVYYHVRIQYGHCAPATQRQTFCAKLRTAHNLKYNALTATTCYRTIYSRDKKCYACHNCLYHCEHYLVNQSVLQCVWFACEPNSI